MTLEADFAARFPNVNASIFNGNMSDLAGYQPEASDAYFGLKGLMTDIGKVMIYQPDVQTNPYSKYIKSPLTRGNAAMGMRFKDIASHQYDPLMADDAQGGLFNHQHGEAITNVAKKNYSRQVSLGIHNRLMRQYQQAPDQVGDMAAALAGTINQCVMSDMWIASREYFSNLRGAKTTQCITLTNDPATKAGAEELNEALWKTTQNYAGYLDTRYNASGIATKSESMDVFLEKSVEYPLFKKMLSETYNPDMLRVSASFNYVPEFGSVTAGAPADAGRLIATVVDPRKYSIIGMPQTVVTSSFYNPSRDETVLFHTEERLFMDEPYFDAFYIFAPKSA